MCVKVFFCYRVALNISPDNHSLVLRSYENFINSLPGNSKLLGQEIRDNAYVVGKVWSPSDSINCQHHILNIPVNYCSKAVLTTSYTKNEHASLRVLAKLLSAKYLHPELREKRGAYGAGARITPDGVLSFFSYRDPKTVDTLDVFDSSYDWIKKHLKDLTDQDLVEAKLGVFQAVDAPVPPSSKGCEDFLRKLTPDTLQRHRAEIMAVSKKNIEDVTEAYLGDGNVLKTGKVILGPKNEELDMSARKNEMWTVVDNA